MRPTRSRGLSTSSIQSTAAFGGSLTNATARVSFWDALARRRKLGFIASSDHLATHNAFAGVYAKGLDRVSLFDALYNRRTYAATDKILVEFSMNGKYMAKRLPLPASRSSGC